MKRALLIFLFFAAVASQVVPSPPSWPQTDVHIGISGSQEWWISYKYQAALNLFPEYLNNNPSVASWFYALYDYTNETAYSWALGPTPELTTCKQDSMDIGEVPSAVALVIGGTFTYTGNTEINSVSVYNWTIEYSNYAYDIFYETPQRIPYAVYSNYYKRLFYFTAFEDISEPVEFYYIPYNVTCFPVAQ